LRKYSESIYQASKFLRKRETAAEKVLWSELKNRQLLGSKFRRQVPYDRFILDFLCPEVKLIIEIDGSSHIGKEERDKERDEYFRALGYKVIRFKNEEVMNNIENVLNEIKKNISGHLDENLTKKTTEE